MRGTVFLYFLSTALFLDKPYSINNISRIKFRRTKVAISGIDNKNRVCYGFLTSGKRVAFSKAIF